VSIEACAVMCCVTNSLPVYVEKGLKYRSEAHAQTNKHDSKTHRQMDVPQTDRQAGRQAGRQTDRQTLLQSDLLLSAVILNLCRTMTYKQKGH